MLRKDIFVCKPYVCINENVYFKTCDIECYVVLWVERDGRWRNL